jgi:streptogramin lyase
MWVFGQDRYRTSREPAGNDVNAVAVAPDGAVWFGTNAGVSRHLPPR